MISRFLKKYDQFYWRRVIWFIFFFLYIRNILNVVMLNFSKSSTFYYHVIYYLFIPIFIFEYISVIRLLQKI